MVITLSNEFVIYGFPHGFDECVINLLWVEERRKIKLNCFSH